MIYFLSYNLYFHYQLVSGKPDLSSEIHMESHSGFSHLKIQFWFLVHGTVARCDAVIYCARAWWFITNIDYFYYFYFYYFYHQIARGNLYFSPLTDFTFAPICQPHSLCCWFESNYQKKMECFNFWLIWYMW